MGSERFGLLLDSWSCTATAAATRVEKPYTYTGPMECLRIVSVIGSLDILYFCEYFATSSHGMGYLCTTFLVCRHIYRFDGSGASHCERSVGIIAALMMIVRGLLITWKPLVAIHMATVKYPGATFKRRTLSWSVPPRESDDSS